MKRIIGTNAIFQPVAPRRFAPGYSWNDICMLNGGHDDTSPNATGILYIYYAYK
jgi:hypothetical protein